MATPKPSAAPPDSPFLEPRESLRLSISPPPGNISFAQTPQQDISFSVTTRVLVKHLTDFEPFEPYWENLRSINFRDKNVTSLDGLKSFCPELEELDIKDCNIRYLTGLPSTMRTLKAGGNCLSGLVSFAWGKNLQYLDLSNNEIDSLAGTSRRFTDLGLSTLIHLRDVKVDNNLLTSLDGIIKLGGLMKVSARHNQISYLDFTTARLSRLEVLECQRNCIGSVEGLEELQHLMILHLGICRCQANECR
jgi:Leucine-rich repeat (LRR) protein